jgi:hypothetical protein
MTERDEAQRQRDRDELARVDAMGHDEWTRRGTRGVQPVADLTLVDAEFVARLEEYRARPVAEPTAADVEAERVAGRVARLERAGVVGRRLRETMAAASGPLPVAGHAGNAAGWATAAEWLKARDCSTLTLAGGSGTGKSWLAAWVVAEVPEALWLHVGACQPGEAWDSLARRAQSTALLVVNDLGVEVMSDWHSQQLAGLLCWRHDEERRTVITTNLWPTRADAPEGAPAKLVLKERYGSRLTRRLLGPDAMLARMGGPAVGRAP